MRHLICAVCFVGLLIGFTDIPAWAAPDKDSAKKPAAATPRTDAGKTLEQAVRLSDAAQVTRAELIERAIRNAVAAKQFKRAVELSLERLHLYPTDDLEHDYHDQALRKLIDRHLMLERKAGANATSLAEAWQPLRVTKAELDWDEAQVEKVDAILREVVPKLADRIVQSHPNHPVAAALVKIDLNHNHGPYSNLPKASHIRLKRHRKNGLGKMGLIWARLEIARDYDHKDKARQSAFEQIADDAVTIEVRQLALVRAGDSATARKDKDHEKTAHRLYRRAIDLNPKTGQANTARVRLVAMFLTDERPQPDHALALIQQMRLKHRDVSFGDPLITIARHLSRHGKPDQSMHLMREVIRLYPQSSGAAFAWIVVAEEHQRAGRTDAMVAAYRRAANLEPLDTRRSIMDASNTRNIAHERLAYHYLDAGDFKESLKWWQRWEPSSWCGTCYAGMVARKRHYTLQCQMKVGLFADAIKLIEPHVWVEKSKNGFQQDHADNDTLWQFIQAHAKLDRLPQLLNRAEAYRKQHKDYDEPRDTTERIVALTTLFKVNASGDHQRLWQCVSGEKPIQPHDEAYGAGIATQQKALHLLGDSKQGRELLFKKLTGDNKTGQHHPVDAGKIAWQLARAGDPRVEPFALDVFKRLINANNEGDDVKYEAESWTYILLKLNKPAGVKLIETIATDPKHPLHKTVHEAKAEFKNRPSTLLRFQW